MDSQMMGNVMMIALSGMGVTIDKVDDQFDKCTFWVSVPRRAIMLMLMEMRWLAQCWPSVLRQQ